MKLKKIKNVLAAFAFIPIENDRTEGYPITRAWYYYGSDEMCVLVKPVSYDEVDQNLGLCTVTILDVSHQLYGKAPNGPCANIILYKCEP
ncbi:hypothetical protein [Flavivirga jejuensis]|uniref:Uncharacterized protein n=1 Tax=Flavivirga jejuensis TaxID=870487 RepID=A0ABT8WVE7_9FLAO|nr:hypothetical protein [Flavivirga jejuensis]MDO5977130.1 hypothetical protein [Flavivirga jejuensis]